MNRLNSKLGFVLILIIISIYISFPFFNIEYFEIGSSIDLINKYLVLPIIIIVLLLPTILYYKYLRQFNPKTNSKIKKIAQDFFNLLFIGIFIGGILFGIGLSTIVTTNAYLGTPKEIDVDAVVLNYIPGKTKFGGKTHQIEFINPNDNKLLRMEVYKPYSIGKRFKKSMKIGYWNQLYAKN